IASSHPSGYALPLPAALPSSAHRWPVNLDGSSSEAPLADVGAVQPAPTAPFVPEPVPVVETTSDGASAPAAEEASPAVSGAAVRSEHRTPELQSRENLVCRLL